MSNEEAIEYVDLVIQELYDKGIISEQKYCTMPESLRHELADKITEKSKE